MPSTVVQSFTYDLTKKKLRVIFTSGIIYEYKKVPESVYEAMKTSSSKGVFLNQHIKGKYDFEKIN